ncbi:IclR family transcriptional regulator domain-containing protein [Geodermatophilus sp. URMC 61]|uniref:IclR family transcriptional regulator domain-containing protein n=1 Tax=Geodermatophilus sp. URMC 61 TaxID=3423411 RepID=UPI00406D0FFD
MDPAPPPRSSSDGGERLEQLERAMAVLESFDGDHPAMTLSEVAELTGMTRAAARRILLTLRSLGFLKSDGREFSLTPKVLNVGWNYFASLGVDEIARPVLADLVKRLNESCSMSTLDLPNVVYVARVHPQRVMTMGGGVGSRLPASTTAAGRVLLATLDDAALDEYLAGRPLRQYTPRTITDPDRFRAALAEVRDQGYCLVDQELEIGLLALSVPVTGRDGRTSAAVSVSSSAARMTPAHFRRECLPPLREAASQISAALSLSDARSTII